MWSWPGTRLLVSNPGDGTNDALISARGARLTPFSKLPLVSPGPAQHSVATIYSPFSTNSGLREILI